MEWYWHVELMMYRSRKGACVCGVCYVTENVPGEGIWFTYHQMLWKGISRRHYIRIFTKFQTLSFSLLNYTV